MLNSEIIKKISMFKYRTYRFTDNKKAHVVAEWIEKLTNSTFINNSSVQRYIYASLEAFKDKKELPETKEIENILLEYGVDLQNELVKKTQNTYIKKTKKPSKIIHIVGSPRSGTSFLYYLLAYSGKFAYFTTESHHLWHTYNLQNTTKKIFELEGSTILDIDTKELRLQHNLIIPSESENIWNSSIPCYTHEGGHSYNLRKAELIEEEKITKNINMHCEYFDRSYFISKTPFNTLRMKCLDTLYPTKTYFIHIYRDLNDCAFSIKKNNFKYKLLPNKYLSHIEARNLFYNTASNYMSLNKLSISYGDLMSNQDKMIKSIFKFIEGESNL
ncbi:MAG TPA: sulfotransferase [Bacteroidia bacterium]|nr:sulfotransferase [Bacteroidia bacterium]